ncbi:NRDE family protein [Alteromonas sp. 5E99-2]|uniref:NRDE family protein n=1 Tax=Alteromonas sp. 5E99-2 TaxID=2817683 RepID=UPI001A99E8B5|nr:NRDE family protein [Alteromonas sp. 5E99-2]MBO1254852.1 NRDE family protein [Alteromonas sp. 5E99-2]
MCILFIAVKQHSDYPLIIAANRDEFHARPTQDSHWWEGNDGILAGKDLQAGGTWMGITKTGKFGALTNIRDPKRIKSNAKSRGELVLNALTEENGISDHTLQSSREDYNGYNLLHGDVDNLKVYNNFENTHSQLEQGVYGLSNAALNSPWPKTTKGMEALSRYCQTQSNIEYEDLFTILRDDVKADDDKLPKTGVPYEWEKKISSAFIVTPEYGTRTSTLLLVSKDRKVSWLERNFDAESNKTTESHFDFELQN